MTTRFRTRWLALFGVAALISLSMSAALGAKPEGENKGQQVSTFVHGLESDAEEPVEEEPAEEEPVEEEPVEEEDGLASDHGQCVAAVARDPEAVGPPNDNHGGAVSEAARVTCWDDEASDESTDDETSEVEEDAEVEEDTEVETEGADSSGPDHAKGNGHGHGGDSSDD